MAITAFPFDGGAGATVSESNYSRLFRELRSSGVADDPSTGAGFQVTAPGGAMTVSVAAGFAILRGHGVYSDSAVALSIGAASGSTRYDRVVLRLDPANNQITPLVIAGTPGAGVPAALQATDTGLWDLPLAVITITSGTAAITSGMIADDRRYVGSDVGVWKADAQRPASPRYGTMGFNIGSARWEWFNGSTWVALSSAVAWSDITGKPSTFAPSSHTHDFSQITGEPSSWTPSAHSHTWDGISGKPTSFPAAAHTHSYAATTHTHSGYATTGHTHPGGDVSSAVSRANGSDRPHANTPQGSTWYAVWVDGNHNFCRNTSSIRYKENVRPHAVNPDKVLQIEPVLYDRKKQSPEDSPAKNEYGLIAEDVHLLVPELVTFNEGQVDGLRYDLLAVALLDVVKRQESRIADLTARLDEAGI